jgi:ribosomal protein L21E
MVVGDRVTIRRDTSDSTTLQRFVGLRGRVVSVNGEACQVIFDGVPDAVDVPASKLAPVVPR